MADSRLAPSQRETSLQSNAVSHWLGASLESALYTQDLLTSVGPTLEKGSQSIQYARDEK